MTTSVRILLRIATEVNVVIMCLVIVIISCEINIGILIVLPWTVVVVVAVTATTSERGIREVEMQQAWRFIQRWQVTQTVRCRQFHMPCIADVPQQPVGDGAMHNAIPVDTVGRSVVCLTTECIM